MAEYNGEMSMATSPRKLQEMALPLTEGHDVTTASGVSLKQYEEQLNALRKENFHLKLRIYFLEEKLGSGSPPAVQGLLEHNVRLQVEVEELRRQLSDKQELLAAAAEAIDVLEQQGSISADSIEGSLNNSIAVKRDRMITEKKEVVDETCAESESAGEFLAETINNDDLDELVRLRRENRKALQMIKGCMKKIQQQDKEIKKVKLNKELTYAHVSDSQLEKYVEILKCKDEHIKDLENKVRDLQKHFENVDSGDTAGNLQQLLTRRLQGLAFFLDKLLSHKCVLGEDKKRLAESILEQSLALPVGLELDESMAPGELTADESALDVSHALRIEDLTAMFGHHAFADDGRPSRRPRQPRDLSDSECWSEPDRNVSLARVGLCDTGVAPDSAVERAHRARRPRLSQEPQPRSDDLVEELRRRAAELADGDRELRAQLAAERAATTEAAAAVATLTDTVARLESRLEEAERRLNDATCSVERMREERRELESTFAETERSLRRAADEATVQASQAALERARAQHDRLRLERELDEARERLAAAAEDNARLEAEVTRRVVAEADARLEAEATRRVVEEAEATRRAVAEAEARLVARDDPPSEEERPTSPDQGIDSDRLSSLEHNDAAPLSPRSLYEENVTLKQKLARTKATLAETLTQLNAANMRKRSVQRAICREIHKTHGVLRKARDQFENQS